MISPLWDVRGGTISSSQLASVQATATVDVDFGIGKLLADNVRVHLWVVQRHVQPRERCAGWRANYPCGLR